MKKCVSLILIFTFILASCSVFAYESEEEVYGFAEGVKYAETYVDSEACFFSASKTIDQTLIEGWETLQESISIKDYGLTIDETKEEYRRVLFGNPKLYYVDSSFRYAYNSSGIVTRVLPVYKETDTSVIGETMTAIDNATEEILMYVDEEMTDFEKVLTVHDYMVLEYDYDDTLSNFDISIMITKTGVCMAYVMAFTHLMNELGIECSFVSSLDAMNHAWNIVKLDGEWYHIDLTWDDLGTHNGQVSHKFTLLSDNKIQSLDQPHFGYDLKDIMASSERFDTEHWHSGGAAVVTIDRVYYYVDGNKLTDQNGKVIMENLDGGDGYWNIASNLYLPNYHGTCLAEYNGTLYFNTDKAIYSYNPKTEQITEIKKYDGICGISINKNTLVYYKFDNYENDPDKESFAAEESIKLGNIRFGGTFHKDNKVIKRMYKEDDARDICVYASCGDCVKFEKLTGSGVKHVEFDAKECQELFFWDDEFRPLKEKEVYVQ